MSSSEEKNEANDNPIRIESKFVKRTPMWHFLPPFCVFFAIRFCFSALLGRKILSLIHPLSAIDKVGQADGSNKSQNKADNCSEEDGSIQFTNLISNLSTEAVKPFIIACPHRQIGFYIDKNFRDSEEKNDIVYKVHFTGNMGRYPSDIEKYSDNQADKKIINIYVNHTNVDETYHYKRNSRCMEDLYATGEAVLHFLIKEQGIDPTKIILHGHSLGGVVATKVAKRCHDKGQKVKLINDRSLTSPLNFLFGGLVPMIVAGYESASYTFEGGEKKGTKSTIIAWYSSHKKRIKFVSQCVLASLIAAPLLIPAIVILLFVLVITGNHFSTGWDYAQIPRKDKCIIEANNDKIIGKPARLSASIYKVFYRKSKFINTKLDHNSDLSDETHKEAIAAVTQSPNK